MLFCIYANSPADMPCQARGRWTVDAEDGQLAVAKLLILILQTLARRLCLEHLRSL
jgi:hypothetical protein